jgi:16S rRNA G527 N7-methylase RsmG
MCATMTSPTDDPTLQKIDDLLKWLRAWQTEATTLLSDPDIRERVEHALLDVAYVFEYLKAARSEKEQKLKLAG